MQTQQPVSTTNGREHVANAIVGLVARLPTEDRRRSGYNAQIMAGIFLLILGYWIGRDHCRLVLFGIKAQGKLVGYKEETFARNSSSSVFTGYVEVIEFRVGEDTVRFRDWMASKFRVPMGGSIPILYDPRRPANAMVDRPVANWIPWGPIMAVGLLLTLSGIRGRLSL